MELTKGLQAHYAQRREEHRLEAHACRSKNWHALAKVQDDLAEQYAAAAAGAANTVTVCQDR
jgi:hypothetical protein